MPFFVLVLILGLLFQEVLCDGNRLQYPKARRDLTVIDNYHGIKIHDPYRWLEDSESVETKKFIKEQNAITDRYLDYPLKNNFLKRLKEIWNYTTIDCPYRVGDYYFYYVGNATKKNVLCRRRVKSKITEIVIDQNKLSGSFNALTFSKNGEILAYGLSDIGSDWFTAYFRDLKTGKDYPDKIENLKYTSFRWTHDHNGGFYMRVLQEGNKGQIKSHKIYYHTIGTSSDEDVAVVDFPEYKDCFLDCLVSDCGRWLIIIVAKDSLLVMVYVTDLSKVLKNGRIIEKLRLMPIVVKFENDYQYVTNDGSNFIFVTNKDAPNYRVIEIDVNNPNPQNWRTLIPEDSVCPLTQVVAVDENKLILCYVHDVKHVMKLYNLSTGQMIYTFPLNSGTIQHISANRKNKEIFYKFVSFLIPPTVYRTDLSGSNITTQVLKHVKVPGVDLNQFQVEQVFYYSKDRTRIPMYIISKKNMLKNGKNPCLLYAYGAYGSATMPSFSIPIIMFISNMNGVYAVAGIRGGGEYGKEWHDRGRWKNKQNSFDDFHSAAEYLINMKYTQPKLLAIAGSSCGGLVVAACANQRPDLYKAVIADMGPMDMLRFHKFTVGHFSVSEFGCPDRKDDFQYIYKYSPLHNARIPGKFVQYPSVLLMTGDRDDKVLALHSLKFIATLQHVLRNHQQTNPLLIKILENSGHGAYIIDDAFLYLFIARTMKLKWMES